VIVIRFTRISQVSKIYPADTLLEKYGLNIKKATRVSFLMAQLIKSCKLKRNNWKKVRNPPEGGI